MPINRDAANLEAVQKFARVPALLSAQHATELMSLASAPARGSQTTEAHQGQLAASFGMATTASNNKPFLFANGLAVIPVWGALLHRDPWCDRWATGYDYIASRFAAALGDEDVKGIVLDINSYGGHVAGNFELAEMIYKARSVKPSAAIVDARALSGGCSLMSACSKVYATPSAEVGSIGVVLTHMNYEKMMEDFGIEVTFIFAGQHKVDGNPYQKLPDDVKAALQASVLRSYDQFVSLVATYRGLEEEAVRNTEASVYDAEEAKAIGLVDAVMPARAAYAAFLGEVASAASTTTTAKEAKKMTDSNTNPKSAGGDEEEIKRAAAEQAKKEATARCSAILQHAEAKGRETLANHLAFEATEVSADQAIAMLAAAPKPAEAAAPTGRLAAAMSDDANKTVGVDGGKDGEDGSQPNASAARVSRLAAAHKAAGRTATANK